MYDSPLGDANCACTAPRKFETTNRRRNLCSIALQPDPTRRVGLSNRIASGAAYAVPFRDMGVRPTRQQHDDNLAARVSRWTRACAATAKWLRLGRAQITNLCDRPIAPGAE